MGFDLLDLLNPVKMIVDAASSKKKHRPLPGHWHRGWTIKTADHAHRLIVSAGSGDSQAQGQLNAIRAAAASGDPVAMKVMALFRPVARMVQLNQGSPSTVARKLLQRRQSQPSQSQPVVKRLQEQLKSMRQAQIVRVQKGKLMAQAQQHLQQERAKGIAQVQAVQAQWDAEAIALEDKLAATEKQLERRDIANSMREQLEAQAAQYEAEIERIEAAKVLQASPPGEAPAVPPLAEDEAASAEPGDVEIEE